MHQLHSHTNLNCKAPTVWKTKNKKKKNPKSESQIRAITIGGLPACLTDERRGRRSSSEYIMDPWQASRQAGLVSEDRRVINLANRTGVVLAGLDVSLQQLDHDGLGQVAGGASLPRRRCVVKGLHPILAKVEGEKRSRQTLYLVWRSRSWTPSLKQSMRPLESLKTKLKGKYILMLIYTIFSRLWTSTLFPRSEQSGSHRGVAFLWIISSYCTNCKIRDNL